MKKLEKNFEFFSIKKWLSQQWADLVKIIKEHTECGVTTFETLTLFFCHENSTFTFFESFLFFCVERCLTTIPLILILGLLLFLATPVLDIALVTIISPRNRIPIECWVVSFLLFTFETNCFCFLVSFETKIIPCFWRYPLASPKWKYLVIKFCGQNQLCLSSLFFFSDPSPTPTSSTSSSGIVYLSYLVFKFCLSFALVFVYFFFLLKVSKQKTNNVRVVVSRSLFFVLLFSWI